MKKSVLLLNIMLILLCGCKSKSFVTQRYTSLGHSPQKHSMNETPVIKKNRALPVKDISVSYEKNTNTPERLLCSNALPLKEAPRGTRPGISISPNRTADPFLNTSPKTVSSLETAVEKSSPGAGKLSQAKKTFKEKVYAARGVLSTFLKIILFVIILAILVAVIVIIVLA
jgi:hypothetical protein